MLLFEIIGIVAVGGLALLGLIFFVIECRKSIKKSYNQ